MTVEAHRQNRVLNHGFIYAIGLYVITYFVALGYFYFLLRADFPRYWPYFWPFTAACLLPAAATLALFFLRGQPGFSTLATVTTYLISLAHNLSMLLFLGLSGGFQFFLAALIPAAYLAHPHRRLIYLPLYLVTVVALVGGVFWVLTHPPLYPIPEPFRSITFYILIGTSSSFFIACFAYVAYKHNWVKRVMVYWEALSVYGLRWTDSDDERTHHIITNQTMVLHSIFPPLILFVSLALSLVLLWQGTEGWWKHLLAFAAVAILSGSLWLLIFLQAAKHWRAGFIFLFFVVDFAVVTCMVFLTGGKLGIQYFYIAMIPLPIYLFPGRRRLVTAEILAIAGAVFGIFFSPKLRPLLEIPQWIVDPVYLIAVTLIVVSLGIGTIYIWLQRKVTQKLYLAWEWVSMLGISNEIPLRKRRHEILLNRCIAISVVYCLPIATANIAFVGIVEVAQGNFAILWLGINYLPPFWLLGACCVFILYQRRAAKKFYISSERGLFIEYFLISGALLLIVYISILMQFKAFFWAFIFVVIAIIGFIPVPDLRGRLINFSFIVVALCAFAVIIAVHDKYGPLMPPPEWTVLPQSIILTSLIAIVLYLVPFYLRHESDKSEGALELAHQKSESLLLNILPRDVADELKDKGHAAPVRIESVTVMFTDFAGFTKISESLSPEQVVDELDKCFSYFDQIMEKYNLEKLKTIGDSYMCAGGIPKPNHTHAIDCCLAAMEIQAFMNQMKDIKAMQGLPYWELRLGIHTGPLVAGVVGHKKFAYDVWGDTVNTASRMESSGTTGKINISRETQERVKFLFDCEHRGQVAAKNKGMIDMFYLNGLKHRFSKGGEGRGRVPNARFREVYAAIARGATLVSKGEHAD